MRLLGDIAAPDAALQAQFVTARRRVKGPLLAVSETAMHHDAAAAQLLQPADHAALWAWASLALASSAPTETELRWPAAWPSPPAPQAQDGGVWSGKRLPLTQEFLGFMLGVQRSTVSGAAAALQAKGLIRYSRGQIEILDREGLKAGACECYGSVLEKHAQLLGAHAFNGIDPFGSARFHSAGRALCGARDEAAARVAEGPASHTVPFRVLMR